MQPLPDGGCGRAEDCAPRDCAPGFDDCDRDASNGCEADLSSKESCGSCGNKCAKLCAPTGCVDECPSPLVPCDGSCVNTSDSAGHCGGCNQACDGGVNADPKCSGATCSIVCRSGFGDCTNTPAKTCAALPKWYVDGDGDNFGGSTFVTACTKPTGYVAAGGDCLDSDPSVHPGAGASDVPFLGAAGSSYDYDCNGIELEEGTEPHYAGACGPGCDGGGYLPLPPRPGAGVNNYCGSTGYHICIPNGATCASDEIDAGGKIRCR